MSPDRFATSTLDAYLRLVRRPVDLAVALLPGHRSGPAAAARITVDRADATIRALLGAVLGDAELTADARMRQYAADERQRALVLRRLTAGHGDDPAVVLDDPAPPPVAER